MNEDTVENVSVCQVCEARDFHTLSTPERWIGDRTFAGVRSRLGLSRCRDCGFVFVNPRPSAELLGRFYSGEHYGCHAANDSEGTQQKANFLLDHVRAVQPRARRLLDFGCGGGLLLRQAALRGFDAAGFDVGGHALRTCRQQGLRVTDRLDTLPARSFDAIVLHHVFEHVSEHREVLEGLARLLSRDGALFIEVPNARSLRARISHPLLSRRAKFDERYRAFPIHLSYFDRATLPRLLQKHGFAVSHVQTYGLGVDELVVNPESAVQAYVRPKLDVSAVRDLLGRRARGVLKGVLFGAGLGENLLVVAQLSSSRHDRSEPRGAQVVPLRSSPRTTTLSCSPHQR